MALAAALGALALPAGASAQVQSFDIARRAVLYPDGLAVPAKVTCGRGDDVMGYINVSQPTTASSHAFWVSCTGATQTLLFPLGTAGVPPFVPGKAIVEGCVTSNHGGGFDLGRELGPRPIRIRHRVHQFRFESALTTRTGCYE